MVTARRDQCPVCRYRWRLRMDGTLQAHHLYSGSERQPECEGSGKPPAQEECRPVGYKTARRIIVAGDWHGNTAWARKVIRRAKTLLADEEPRIILHLGDFGVWPGPGGQSYLAGVSDALKSADAVLWFVDGNHEAFPLLHDKADQNRRMLLGSIGEGEIAPGIYWQPRGTRWLWHGRTWLALGGGVSLDKAIRTEGRDWWPEEEITDDEEYAAIESGRADVMVTHDCPARVTHTFPPRPPFWDLADLARSDAHRERLQRVVDAVQPSHLMHGHLHIGYQRVTDFGYGPVQVTGLDRDGAKWNYAVLDVKTMEWEARVTHSGPVREASR